MDPLQRINLRENKNIEVHQLISYMNLISFLTTRIIYVHKMLFCSIEKKRTRLRVTCDHNRIIYKIKDTALSCRLFTYFKNSSKELFILLQKKN